MQTSSKNHLINNFTLVLFPCEDNSFIYTIIFRAIRFRYSLELMLPTRSQAIRFNAYGGLSFSVGKYCGNEKINNWIDLRKVHRNSQERFILKCDSDVISIQQTSTRKFIFMDQIFLKLKMETLAITWLDHDVAKQNENNIYRKRIRNGRTRKKLKDKPQKTNTFDFNQQNALHKHTKPIS